MLYVMLVAAVLIFGLLVIDRPTLKVSFHQGKITQEKGHLSPNFKHNLQEIGEKTSFYGWLKVYKRRTGAKLVFSKSVPKKVQQRIRNVFPHQSFDTKGKKKSS